MSKRHGLTAIILGLGLSLVVSGCGSGQLFGPMLTAVPTNTATPTPTSTPTETQTPIPQPTPVQVAINDIHFSFVAPEGWVENSQDQWIAPNGIYTLGLETTPVDAPAKDTMDASLASMNVASSDILSSGAFQNDAGIDAYKAVFKMKSQGVDLIIALYIFHQGNMMVIATFARPSSEDAQVDATVDASMATLKFD